MDYKKKYEGLLARLQEAKENVYKTDERYCCVIDSIVPELKESEDEKARRVLREIVLQWKNGHQAWCSDNKEIDAILAWLKNQGEKGTKGNEREIPFATWSEEDENIRQWIISDIDKLLALKKKSFIIADKEINWLKSLKDRVQPQPKQDWSGEDEEMLTAFLHKVEVCDLLTNRESVWVTKRLKSLKERYTWKPSDEQMEQLGWIAKQNKDSMIGKELMTLYNDLKKLRGE